jgi:hypothetical protein
MTNEWGFDILRAIRLQFRIDAVVYVVHASSALCGSKRAVNKRVGTAHLAEAFLC